MVRCAISDGTWMPGHARQLATDGVDLIQLRMKHASAREQLNQARELGEELRGSATKLLINGRADVALAAGAHGVHLTSAADELTPMQVRQIFATAGAPVPIVSRSCHSLDDVRKALWEEVEWILFGPVFEKVIAGRVVQEGVGLGALRAACEAAPRRVLALGGVDAAQINLCLEARAAGVAGIRIFRREEGSAGR